MKVSPPFNPDAELAARSGKLMHAIDALNRAYSRDTVMIGSAGIQRRWEMKSENRSPRYTTRWQELPRVLAR